MKAIWLASFAIFAAAAFAGAADEPGANATWYSLVTDSGDVIGYAFQDIVQHSQGREIVEAQEIVVGERDVSPTRLFRHVVLKENKDGRPISIDALSQVGDSATHKDARILADKAIVEVRTESERRTVTIPLPADVRFDTGEALLKTWDPAAQPRLEFENFNIEAMSVDHVVIEAIAPAGDGGFAAWRRTYAGSELVGVARLTLDRDRRAIATTQPMMGADLTIKLSNRQTALQPHPAYHLLPRTMTKSPFVIPESAKAGHVRYHFSFKDGIVFAIPQTAEQRVATEGETATVDICVDCGPGLPTDKAYLADATRATTWLQSDDEKLKRIAVPVAGLDASDTRKMEILLRIASPYLGRLDFNGHFSALETLKRHRGDCTEAAVLLAALGRAAGIPTRVADGLVYSRERYHGVSNAFMPHSWTLAYVDGKWRSFDLALDTFDATHIALTIGDGDERSIVAANQLSSLLKWDAMAEVRSASLP